MGVRKADCFGLPAKDAEAQISYETFLLSLRGVRILHDEAVS
jgi:hypothetical protein